MKTWNDYKNYVKSESPESRREIEECEELSHTISSAVNGLYNFGLSDIPSIEDISTQRGIA